MANTIHPVQLPIGAVLPRHVTVARTLPQLYFIHPGALFDQRFLDRMRRKRKYIRALQQMQAKASSVLLPVIAGQRMEIEYVTDEDNGLLRVRLVSSIQPLSPDVSPDHRHTIFDLSYAVSEGWGAYGDRQPLYTFVRRLAFGTTVCPKKRFAREYFSNESNFARNDAA